MVAEELGKIIRMAGMLLKHAVGVMMLCWRRMLRAGALAGALGIVLTEIAAILVTRSPFPGWPAQLVAAAVGFSLAYAVALTVFVEEFVRGVIDMIRQLEGDAAGAARAAEHLAERELGEVHLGLQHMLGIAAPLAWAGAQMKSARANVQKRQAERQRIEAARAAQRAREAEAARQRAEAEAKRRAEEAKKRAEQEAARKQAQAEAQRKAEAERKQAEEAERQRRAEEAKRRVALEEGRRQAQEEARQRAEAMRRQRAEDAERARQLQEEERKQRAAAAAASLNAAAGAFSAAVRAPHDQRTQPSSAAHTDEQPPDEAEEINLASVTQAPYTPAAPVPASSLPRIEWSYEHPVIKLPKESNGASRPADETANQPQQTLTGAPGDMPTDDPDATFRRAVAAMRSPDAAENAANAAQGSVQQSVVTPRPGASYPQTPPPPRLQPVEEPIPVLPMGQRAPSAPAASPTSANAETSGANAETLEAPTLPARQRGDTQPAQSTGANGQGQGRGNPAQTVPNPNGKKKSVPITQPLNAVTRPLPTMSRPTATSGNSGLWERLSQALVGKPPTVSRPLDTNAQQQADEDNPLGNIRSLPPLPTEGLDDETENGQ